MKKKAVSGAILLVLLSGCAERSGVYPSGDGTHSISNQAATGFSGLQDIQAEAYREANEYCYNLNEELKIVHESTTKPPYILGNFPRITLKFKCKKAEQ